MERAQPPSWRRLPIGVELDPDGGAHARVWAPKSKTVELVEEGGDATVLTAEENGYFSGAVRSAKAGTRYRFRLDGRNAFPDPASRYQPDGPHGPSQIIDPAAYEWRAPRWNGATIDGQVISEIHIGTFTPEGTFRSAIDRLDHFVDVGITCIEIMPINEFGGAFGWGYDGVNWFAPTHHYGTPDDLRALVDAAHERGIAVILDVVYNHLGPDGNYLPQYSDTYMTKRATEWGEAINYDGEGSCGVRELAIENAGYWISEFRLDGLRLDATQNIYDASAVHLVEAIANRARAAADGRPIIIIGENEPQDTSLVTARGVDALWNDDFHHAAYVAMTGNNDAYLSGYRGSAQEFISAAKRGFLYQGQYYPWQDKRRGTSSLQIAPKHFVSFLESHDQVANLSRGARRSQINPTLNRAFTGLLLLSPQTPMLFQGQEFGSASPFAFFAGHSGDLAKAVQRGRTQFQEQFRGVLAVGQATVPDPADPETMRACRIEWSERDANRAILDMHRDLITLRRTDPVISRQLGADTCALDGAVLAERAFVLRYFSAEHDDRLLVVNLGVGVTLEPAPEPLLAPPPGSRWKMLWSSESVRYGGLATPALDEEGAGWRIPSQCTVLLSSERMP